MQTTDTLFRLIKSLSKNEKGYFKKLFIVGDKTPNFILLFDAIDKQEEYNEDEIVKKFRKEKFVKQLSVTKHYLFEQILKALRSYNSQFITNALINDTIENSQLLFSRGLYPNSFSELVKAETLAEKFDLPLKLLEIKARERALHLEIAAKDWTTQIGENLKQTRKILDDYGRYLELFDMYYRLMYFWRHERTIRTEEQRTEFEKMMLHPLLQSEPQDAGFYTKQLYLTIHMIYNFISNNDEQSFQLMSQILKMWDDNPAMKTEEPVKYLSAVNNYFNTCYKLTRFNLIRDYLKTFDNSFVERNEALQAIHFETFSTYKLVLLYAENKFDESAELLIQMREGIKKYEGRINKVRVMLMKFNSMILYWIQNQFSEAIDMANEIFDEKDVDLRADVQAATRIVYLILHFELNNAQMLDYAIRSSKRYLQTREKYYELEKIFFRHFLQLNHSSDKHERMRTYKALHEELTELFSKNDLEKNFLQTFNVFNWLDAKIEGITLKEKLIHISEATD
jgi:hypothetical protein